MSAITLRVKQWINGDLNVPREQRHCSECQTVEDEKHFVLHCKINKQLHNKLFTYLNSFNSYIGNNIS